MKNSSIESDSEIFSTKLINESIGSQFPNHDDFTGNIASQPDSVQQLEKEHNKNESLPALSHPSPEPKEELIEVALDYAEQIVAKLLDNKKRVILEEKMTSFNDSVMKLV